MTGHLIYEIEQIPVPKNAWPIRRNDSVTFDFNSLLIPRLVVQGPLNGALDDLQKMVEEHVAHHVSRFIGPVRARVPLAFR